MRIALWDGAELRVMSADQWAQVSGDTDTSGVEVIDVPDGWPDAVRWNGAAFVPVVPALDAQRILSLFTPAERAACRRLIFATFPAGHPHAGELIDPTASAQVLMDSLIARRDPLPLDDPYFTQGVAMLTALGILTQARAAHVLAGLLPEG